MPSRHCPAQLFISPALMSVEPPEGPVISVKYAAVPIKPPQIVTV